MNSSHYTDAETYLNSIKSKYWHSATTTFRLKNAARDANDDILFESIVNDRRVTNAPPEIQAMIDSLAKEKNDIRFAEECLDVLKKAHYNGEELYWVLYYFFFDNSSLSNKEIMGRLRQKGYYYCDKTLYRRRQAAIEAFSDLIQ